MSLQKYIDSKTSREESTQNGSIRGLHKKQGKFSHAVDHLVCSQVKCDGGDDDDDHNTVTEPINNKIDMSNIDFGNKKVESSNNNTDGKQDSSSKLQDENNNVLPSLSIKSELESEVLNDPVQPTSILYEGHAHRELIDGMKDDNYVAVLNCIDSIYDMLQDHNNGDTDVTWYDTVDIFSV